MIEGSKYRLARTLTVTRIPGPDQSPTSPKTSDVQASQSAVELQPAPPGDSAHYNSDLESALADYRPSATNQTETSSPAVRELPAGGAFHRRSHVTAPMDSGTAEATAADDRSRVEE